MCYQAEQAINLAAGLEDSIIEEIKPELNDLIAED